MTLREERRTITWFVLIVGLFWAGLYAYTPVLAPRAARIGASVGSTGLILGTYGLAEFLIRVPLGLWSDRVPRRKPLMLVAFLLAVIAEAGMGLSGSPLSLGLFRGLSGVAASAWVPVTLLALDLFPRERKAWALGLINFAGGAGQLGGLLLGGAAAQWAGFTAPFFAAGSLTLVGALMVAVLVRERPRPERKGTRSVKEQLAVARHPRLLIASLLGVLNQFLLFSTVFGFLPLYAANHFGAGGGALGILSFLFIVPSSLMTLFAGRIGDRVSRRSLLVPGFLLAAIGAALLPVAGSFVTLVLFGMVIGGAIGILTPSLMTAAVEDIDPEQQGSAMGFYQSVYAVGSFSGPAIAGAVGAHLGYGPMFLSVGVAGLLGAGASWWLM